MEVKEFKKALRSKKQVKLFIRSESLVEGYIIVSISKKEALRIFYLIAPPVDNRFEGAIFLHIGCAAFL